MKKYNLNGIWKMAGNNYEVHGNIPGSVYSFLHIDNKILPNPYYRDNEFLYLETSKHEYAFTKEFNFNTTSNKVNLVCEGLDTLCSIYVNDNFISNTDNMHVKYSFDVSSYLKEGKNSVKIICHPINEYITKKNEKAKLFGAFDSMQGYPYLRKAHCMMGWDWSPRLPDAGIWRDIYLVEKDSPEILSYEVLQYHEDGKVFILPKVESDGGEFKINALSPSGEKFTLIPNKKNEIKNPKLWWPNGLGEQNLYKIEISLIENDKTVDSKNLKVGLRELKLIRQDDKDGQSYYHEINGVKMFAMGADYIPEDNIFSRITKNRTLRLLTECKNSNFNTIRVWGGGYYPDDFFFDICDELGLVVFFDLMFACAVYEPDDAMNNSIEIEVKQNLSRIRHHACLGVICGNNEIEWHLDEYIDISGRTDKEHLRKVYLKLFEQDLPKYASEVAPYIPYVYSSPTSLGGFKEPNAYNFGDSHYWDFENYKKCEKETFRYISEFGYCSYASIKTINSFTDKKDRNAFSKIMEMHQRNSGGTASIAKGISENFLYPNNFESFIYASQLLQAEMVKAPVEHLRRNRGVSMGTLYWQVNDMCPVNSFSSIDYFGRYKALQYVAKRFYLPILISAKKTSFELTRPFINAEKGSYSEKKSAKLFVTNDTLNDVSGVIRWELRDNLSNLIKSGKENLSVFKLSVNSINELDFTEFNEEKVHLYYSFVVDGKVVSYGSELFTNYKYYEFENPKLSYKVKGNEIAIKSNAYAKYVEIDGINGDVILSDNFFDMEKGEKKVYILSGKATKFTLRSVYDIR